MSLSITGAILMLIGSLAILIFASQKTINLIENLMEMTGISESAAGFIILATMSSLGELIVAIFSVMEGEPAISIGDIFGSHVFNIGLVLGLLSVLGYLKICHSKELTELHDILFLASIIPLFLLLSHFQAYNIAGSPVIGVILIVIYFSSLIIITKRRKKKIEQHPEQNSTFIQVSCEIPASEPNQNEKKEEKIELNVQKLENNKENIVKDKKKIILTLLKIIFFAGMVILAGRLIITSAITIMETFNILGSIIGAKVIAIGTSLPELMFCYIAAKRGKIHLALGDLLGANLTTSTFVLGLVLLLAPFQINLVVFTEMIIFIIITNLLLMRFFSKGGISQTGGIIFILLYVLFQAIL